MDDPPEYPDPLEVFWEKVDGANPEDDYPVAYMVDAVYAHGPLHWGDALAWLLKNDKRPLPPSDPPPKHSSDWQDFWNWFDDRMSLTGLDASKAHLPAPFYQFLNSVRTGGEDVYLNSYGIYRKRSEALKHFCLVWAHLCLSGMDPAGVLSED